MFRVQPSAWSFGDSAVTCQMVARVEVGASRRQAVVSYSFTGNEASGELHLPIRVTAGRDVLSFYQATCGFL